jgi:hypothetical protein
MMAILGCHANRLAVMGDFEAHHASGDGLTAAGKRTTTGLLNGTVDVVYDAIPFAAILNDLDLGLNAAKTARNLGALVVE